MPAVVAASRSSRRCNTKDVDGRDIGVRKHAVLRTTMPGHDVERHLLAIVMPALASPALGLFNSELFLGVLQRRPNGYCCCRKRICDPRRHDTKKGNADIPRGQKLGHRISYRQRLRKRTSFLFDDAIKGVLFRGGRSANASEEGCQGSLLN